MNLRLVEVPRMTRVFLLSVKMDRGVVDKTARRVVLRLRVSHWQTRLDHMRPRLLHLQGHLLQLVQVRDP